MALEQILLATPTERWKPGQAIVFDWYDGPRAGICRLTTPPVEFHFRLLAERPTVDDLDDRLLLLSEIPGGSVQRTLAALRDLGGPTAAVWVPVWRFPTDAARQEAERLLGELEQGRRETSLILHTRDMIDFLGCWQVTATDRWDRDWFRELSIPPKVAG
jgi:hypothetical protein